MSHSSDACASADSPRCPGCDDVLNKYRPALIAVVDETGASELCGPCVVQVLARFERAGDLTLLVSRPTVA